MSANYILNNPAWLGEIPSHWDCKKIGSLFTERKVKVSDKEYPPLSVAKIGVVPQLDTAVKTDAGTIASWYALGILSSIVGRTGRALAVYQNLMDQFPLSISCLHPEICGIADMYITC